MKKIRIFTFSGRQFFQNFIIAIVLILTCSMAFFCLNLTPVAKIVNGAYYSGNKNSNKITLMINVYWGTEYLEEMLDILEKYNVKTTFFVGGTWAVQESDMLERIVSDGHEIANHGYAHKEATKLSVQQCKQEILQTHKIVKELVGIDMNLYAPPSGAYNKQTVTVANELGYKVVMWTEGRDTIDWRDHDSELIYKRATQNCKGGDFVLMHPTEETKNALERIIIKLQNDGFKLCTITENLTQN